MSAALPGAGGEHTADSDLIRPILETQTLNHMHIVAISNEPVETRGDPCEACEANVALAALARLEAAANRTASLADRAVLGGPDA